MQKLVKDENSVFLAIVRATNESPQKRNRKRSSNRAARFGAAHEMTLGLQRRINKEIGPRKDIITVAEREQQVLESVPVCHRGNLEKLIKEYRDVFLEKLPKGVPPLWEV